MDLPEVLRTLARLLAERGIRFAVIGGLGLHAYGLRRATFDVDLLVDGEVQAEVVAMLEDLGYQTLHVSRGYSNHLHPETSRGRVDCVYVRGVTSDEIFAGCSRHEVFSGFSVPVPRPEHLAALKVHAMSNDPERTRQEMVDLRFLLDLPETVRAAVREQFEKRDLLEEYRELTEED
jgi:hypothetical protein